MKRKPHPADAVRHHLGDAAFLRTDSDQKEGLVTGIMFRPGTILYYVTWGDRTETAHYDFELTRDRSFETSPTAH